MDVVTPAKRSEMMGGIKQKNTRPELTVRRVLFAQGFRYRLHHAGLRGSPDIVLPGRKIAIFVHGCFWHQHSGCRLAKLPETNGPFWKAKLNRNVTRDKEVTAALIAGGWHVLVVYECATRNKSREELAATLNEWIHGAQVFGEIPEPNCSAA